VAIAFRGSQRQGTFLLRAGSYSGVSMLECLDLDLVLRLGAVTNSRVSGKETRTARLPSQKIIRRGSRAKSEGSG
jgi:hypothetical protein